jgi:hypothetical protein
MVQGYYSLEEAARILGMAADELNQMAQRREVRAFADRGTWRFRTQDIEELARRRGLGSSPDLPIGEAPRARPHDSPTHKPKAEDEGVFKFGLGADDTDLVEIGQEILGEAGPSKPASSGKLGPKSPTPKPGSDSDVRLVADGSDSSLQAVTESDVPLADPGKQRGSEVPLGHPSDVLPLGEAGKQRSSDVPLGRASDVLPVQDMPSSSKSDKKKKDSDVKKKDSDVSVVGEAPSSKVPAKKGDSGVRLVPVGDSDSDVKIVPESTPEDSSVLGAAVPRTGSDSDVRIELSPSGRRSDKDKGGFLTEEIDLDAELRKAEETRQAKKGPPKAKPASAKSVSPFELSEDDLEVSNTGKPESKSQVDSDSDFELERKDDVSSVELTSEETRSKNVREDEEVALGEAVGVAGSSDSGINLQSPADSGISLEHKDDSDEIEFELTLDAEGSPKPPPAAPVGQESSDFELTLEDSARLAPSDSDRVKQAKKEGKEGKDEEKDIFETDFEVPALEDESGSQAVALDESDTDLESSDFDLALGEEDIVADEESGSQVVALEDEEEVDEAAATVARTGRRGRAALVEEEVGEGLAEEEEEVVPSRRAAAVAAAPADWGLFLPIVLLFSTFVLFFVGIMSFELLHNMWGYHQPSRAASPLVQAVAGMFYDAKELPQD